MNSGTIKGEAVRGPLGTVHSVLALLFAAYQLYYIRAIPYEPAIHGIVHLGFAMVVLLMGRLRESPHSKLVVGWLVCLLLAAVAVTAYFFVDYRTILANPSRPPTVALVFGVIAVIVAVILSRQSFGMTFPLLAAVGCLYVLYGRFLPGIWRAPAVSIQRAITLLAADVTSPWGLYGSLLGISANYLFLFILFGSTLHAFGGLRFVFQLGSLVAARVRSGAAAMAVISSALLGSITGSTVANVTITGSFTIPMMMKEGYTPEQAAAIETAASNGGQFLPPVMGATVFVMAAYTGIPYIDIARAALVPALLYFLAVFLYCELNAARNSITPTPANSRVNMRETAMDALLFITPLAVLAVLMLEGYSLMAVIFWATIAAVGGGLLSAAVRRKDRLDWAKVIDTLSQGVKSGAEISVLLAVIGIFVGALEVTGLTLDLSVVFGRLAGDSVFLLLVATVLISLILGTGVPTPAAYVIVATVLSPLLIRQGIPVLQAHLFPLFYAFIAHLTPPVGLGLLVACKIAGSNYWRSAVEVFKAAFVSVILPFCFIYAPGILLDYETPAVAIAEITASALLFFSLTVFSVNHWRTRLAPLERLALLAACLFSAGFIGLPRNDVWIALSALAGLVAVVSNQRRPVVAHFKREG